MRSILVRLALFSAITLIAGHAIAQQRVYQWKDAQGRTHYSSSPPASGVFKSRAVATDTPRPAAKPVAPESAQCTSVRANLATLKANSNVLMDSDGDGKPDRTLSADEHANQLKLAESYLVANCGGTAQP